jgi:hypothetical protein
MQQGEGREGGGLGPSNRRRSGGCSEKGSPEVPALVCTGFVTQESRGLLEEQGVPVLQKPVRSAELCNAVAELLLA